MKFQYMHTICGKPAFKEPHQIVYASRHSPAILVKDLRTIRREQQASIQWRRKRGFSVNASDYGYVRVRVYVPTPCVNLGS